jgi:hypothetical protein
MKYDVNVKLKFDYPWKETYKSAYLSAQAMKAKILMHDPENGVLHVQFDKKLYGAYLGDRSRFEIDFSKEDGPETLLTILAFPVNPIGQKLMFGARKGVIPKVLRAFQAEMAKRLEAGI